MARVEPPSTLVLHHVLPNGSKGTWAFVLRCTNGGGTRLLFRRRGERASLFDRIMLPGYYLMDRGMLAGIKRRAEGSAIEGSAVRVNA